jgi:AbiV family abortive infection protein
MPTSVTPQYLLEGAAYALEQCGLLLRDANLLYRNGSHASAVALAAFAQEELGRWKMVHDLRKKVLGGARVTIKQIQTRCGDHVRKQEAGVMSIVMRADKDSGLGKLLQTQMSSKPGSEEWKAARKEIEKLDHQKKKRVPGDRHEQRMSALYVDAVSPDQWNRPTNEISPTLAFERLQEAANDYSIQYDRYTNLEIGKLDDPEFYTALEEWTDRPTLAPPDQPLLPTTLASPDQPLLPSFAREPMSEKLGRLPSVAFWIAITLLAAVLVICLLGSIIGLMEPAPEPQSPHLTTYGEPTSRT